MAAKKVKLLNQAGDELYPRTTIDNILTGAGSTKYAQVVQLNGVGKIDPQYLPSYVDDVVELVAMQGTAPTTCETGDIYFNTNDSLLYTATAANVWGAEGEAPSTGVIYMDLTDSKIYRWSGSVMMQIYEQYAITSNVTSNSDNSTVPTAKAAYDIASSLAASAKVEPAGSAGVATELGGVYVGSNIQVNGGGTISVAGGGIGTPGVLALASATSAATTANDTSTAVTPKGLATVLTDFQPKFTHSSNVTITAGTISVATGGASLGVVAVPSGTHSGVAVAVNAGTVTVSGVAATSASAGVMRFASAAEVVAGTTVSNAAVTPAQADGLVNSKLTAYQPKITTSSNVSISADGATISVATGSAGLGLTYVPTSANNNGVAVTNTAGTVSIAGVAATAAGNGVVRLASATEAVKGATVTGAVVMSPKQTNDMITSHLSSYQVKFTNTTNVTVDGASISVAVAGAGSSSKGVIAVDQTTSHGAALSITDGVVKVTMAAAAIGTEGAIAIASNSDVQGPTVTGGVYSGGNFSGTGTAVNPAQLGSALGIAVFYQEL